jgi:hypothetical protein
VRPDETLDKSIEVIHGYELDGDLKEERVHLDGPTDYSINCPQEPKNIFVRMEVASD